MQNIGDYLIPGGIAFIMLGIGLSLKFKDFSRVFLRPKGILIGLSGQFFFLPALAFLMAWLLPIDPLHKVGLVLIASAPGGTASNLVTHMLKGRVALSVSLTSFNSLGILLSIPLYLNLALFWFMGTESEISIGFLDTFTEIAYTVVLPVVAGILLNEYGPHKLIVKLQEPLRFILPGVLFLIFGYHIFLEDDGSQTTALMANYGLFIPLILFNMGTMIIGYFLSIWAGMKHDGAYTISIELGLQNAALAIFIATQVLERSEISLVAVMYSSFSFFSTLLIAWLLKRKYGKSELAATS